MRPASTGEDGPRRRSTDNAPAILRPFVPPAAIGGAEDQRKRRLLAAILLVTLAVGAALTALEIVPASLGAARITVDMLISVGALVSLGACLALNRRGHYDAAAYLTVWIPALATFVAAVPSPSLDDLTLLYYLVIPLLAASILLASRDVALLAAANTVGILALAIFLGPDAARLPVATVLITSAVTLMAAHYRDLLEKDRRRSLVESEGRFRSLVAHAPEAILLLEGVEGKVVEANGRATDLFGASWADLVGSPFRLTALARGEANAAAARAVEDGIERALAGEEPVFDLEYTRGEQGGISCETRLVRLPGAGRPLVRASFTDVTTRRQTESRLRFLATHDILTQLPNRGLFGERLKAAIARARRTGQQVAVAFLDVDDFKTVNDALGHAAGDQLLREVADRLKASLRETDTVARRSGDEFSLLLENVTGQVGAVPILWKLLTRLSEPFQVAGREVFVTVSLGVAVYPVDGSAEEQLERNADTALYQAKADGKSTYRFYTSGLAQSAVDRLALASRLRHALDRQELYLCYQPQVQVSTGRVLGFEALVRWKLDEAVVSPGVFIPMAEETGVIGEIGAWALRTACAHLGRLREAGHTHLTMSVNISGRQLHGSLIATVTEALQRADVPGTCLLLELTENILFREGTEDLLKEIRATGARLAVDDFGTGYTTLWLLPRFPLEELKIDKRFADGIATQAHDDAIVGGIVGIGKRLGLRIVAEGVENDDQLRRYVAHGCDVVQGYRYSPPCTAVESLDLLKEGRFPPFPG